MKGQIRKECRLLNARCECESLATHPLLELGCVWQHLLRCSSPSRPTSRPFFPAASGTTWESHSTRNTSPVAWEGCVIPLAHRGRAIYQNMFHRLSFSVTEPR